MPYFIIATIYSLVYITNRYTHMLTKSSKFYTNLFSLASLFLPCFAIAQPAITTVTGEITSGTTLIIKGSGFTEKANPEPLLWWKADFGEAPSPLGRLKTWSDTTRFGGNFSTAIVAPGSQRSVGKNHSGGGVALSRVDFDSDRLYFFRKTYEDFDVTKNTVIKPGTTDFRTFNFKTFRFWSATRNNMFASVNGSHTNQYNFLPALTDGTIWNNTFTHNHLVQVPFAWKVEELEYKTSSLGQKDGVLHYYHNGLLATNQKVRTRTSEYPDRYSRLFQSQVSNGAKDPSIMYYDSLYVDDTWHRVVICKSKTWEACHEREIQIPVSWNDKQIEIKLNLGGFDPKASLFVYVVDKNAAVNDNGFPLCLKCPLPPTEK